MIKLSSGCGTSQLQLYTIPIKAALIIDAAVKFLITKKSPKRQIPAPNWRNLLSFSILARSAIVARNVDKTTRQHTNGRFRIVSEFQIFQNIYFSGQYFFMKMTISDNRFPLRLVFFINQTQRLLNLLYSRILNIRTNRFPP